MWEHERHRLQTAARQRHIDERAARKQQEAAHRQRLLDERAANKCQEANCCQQLLDERAAYERQEAVRCQWLLDEETAHRQRLLDEEAARRLMAKRAAHARQMAAARTIFLWLRRRRLHIRLVRQTSRHQQREAALARLRYEQDCCRRAALAEEQRRQAAAARVKAAINEATKQLRRVGDALRAIALEEAADERRRHEAAAHAKALVAQELEEAADERRRHEAAAHAKALAAQELAEAAAHAKALAAKVLADERGGQESAVRAKVFAAQALAIAPSLPPRPTSYAAAVLSTLGGSLLPAVPSPLPLPTTGSPLRTVCRRIRPCRCTGCRNRPRAPSPIDEALPSHPQPTWGRTSTPISAVPTLLARAISIPRSELARASSPTRSVTPSQLLSMTESSSPSLQPFDVKNAVSMLLDVGGAHPFRDCGLPLPPRKRAHGRRHPRRICRRHGPRAPNSPEPLLCGRRHRPRTPNQSTVNGWA